MYLITKAIDHAFEDDDDPIDLDQGVTIRPSAIEAVYPKKKENGDWHVYIRTVSDGVIDYPFDGDRTRDRADEVAQDIGKKIGAVKGVEVQEQELTRPAIALAPAIVPMLAGVARQ